MKALPIGTMRTVGADSLSVDAQLDKQAEWMERLADMKEFETQAKELIAIDVQAKARIRGTLDAFKAVMCDLSPRQATLAMAAIVDCALATSGDVEPNWPVLAEEFQAMWRFALDAGATPMKQ